PSTGIVTRFIEPEGPGVRVDSGIASGDEITQFYDPMIAKLIVYGEDRPAAIARMQDALEHSVVFGVKTNLPLLHSIVTHPAFQDGRTHTGFLVEYGLMAERVQQEHAPLLHEALIAAAVYDSGEVKSVQNGEARNPWKMLG